MPRESYLKWDFDNFNEVGLAPLKAEMGRQKVRVVDISGTNKPSRVSGVPVKEAVLALSDGQSLTLKVTSKGAVYQARLNNRVIAIREKENLKVIARELAAIVKKNRASFREKMGKKLAALESENAEKPKKRIQNTRTRLKEIRESNSQLEGRLNSLRERVNELNQQREATRQKVEEKRAQLASLHAENSALMEEIEKKGGHNA